jgi:hypothetical protein
LCSLLVYPGYKARLYRCKDTTALEHKGWAVTVVSSEGWEGAGSATYGATRGTTYGVFSGGGAGSRTDLNACAWPSQPSNPNCGGGNRR